ncbi:malto-oligosyltrehalose synthase [Rhizobium sp. AAP43]|uniref:malto-oligosyltrehalose synthase n=1 Tax=Rhizobium sp. AAP43 TaxID=1523420 RepID=UPI0006B99772|nr:malto-oligosyltrehalose synthase [Rhizobium sp. AAP43]KPF46133.1 hypothetical protein IP76_04240 [Rhizobium sp. AAP43]
MSVPVSTYRLQFRGGMDFERAASLVPYLRRLGISHLYASPIFAATDGSTHGYDVTDANLVDPTLGGRQGLEALARVLKSNGMGLILDIVPNHMAASLENPWWRSVIEWGEASPFSHYFDIDWSRRLTLPFLGASFDDAVANGDLKLDLDRERGTLVLRYIDSGYPLLPETYPFALVGFKTGLAAELAALGKAASADRAQEFHAAVSGLCESPDFEVLQQALAERSADPAFLVALHKRQPWQLIAWTEAAKGLNYRRFFEIAGLVGLRVEDEAVFAAAHQAVLDMVGDGLVQGLRIDHVDGLADPAAYLRRLRDAVGHDLPIFVEKILAPGEDLPADWPVEGSTGYEFIAAEVPVLLDSAGFLAMRQGYETICGTTVDVATEMREAKLRMVRVNFAGEVDAVLRLARGLLGCEAGPLRRGLEELLVAFPRYRSYGTQTGLSAADGELLDAVLAAAERELSAVEREAASALVTLLKGDGDASDPVRAAELRRRFQQLTGPLMAKALEDTLFFRHVECLALNEVGGELEPPMAGLDHFHAEMTRRSERQPRGLSASSTHDTKRGEDARARLFALAEDAPRFATLVEKWRAMDRPALRSVNGEAAPEPRLEWMIYQSLVGHWPINLAADDRDGVAAFCDRFVAFLEKSMREAKLRSDWADVNEDYESAVADHARALLDRPEFLKDFVGEIQSIMAAGLINGLTQTALKLTAPGIPDIYQGSEVLDFSFVDPDNRRPPAFEAVGDFEVDAAPVLTDPHALATGRAKQALIARGLRLRHDEPLLFSEGTYTPLQAVGARQQHVVAFARRHGGYTLLTIAIRLPLSLQTSCAGLEASKFWGDTGIDLPDDLETTEWRDVLTGRRIGPGSRLSLRDVLGPQPVALLVAP